MNKVIQDGKVAVLYSPGFGAGWSTWANKEQQEFMLFDPGLVNRVQNQATEFDVKLYVEALFGEASPYIGGWRDIEIMWLPIGTVFEVTEYDGSESIEIIAHKHVFTA